MCINQVANCACGFTGADPNFVVPNWRIIKRNRNGVIVSDVTVSGIDITTNTVDGLQWIVDPHNGNNSLLRVGPVGGTDDQSSYQCIFATANGGNVESDMGTLTVIGKINNYDQVTAMCFSIMNHTYTQESRHTVMCRVAKNGSSPHHVHNDRKKL